jgi:hypothetical protein
MTLSGEEFLRRFSQHILPTGFTKVRHFGLHAGANQHIMDELHQELYHKPREPKLKETWQEIALKKTGYIESKCPKCTQNTLQTVGIWHTNKPPPDKYKHLIMNTY